MLLSTTIPPKSRLSTQEDAKKYLDTIAKQYAHEIGIFLETSVEETAHKPRVVSKDTLASETVPEHFIQRKLELYAKKLQIDLRADGKLLEISQRSLRNLQGEMHILDIELGEEFKAGIRPTMAPCKARVYRSAWNWAIQDLLKLLYSIIRGDIPDDADDFRQRVLNITNKSSSNLVACMSSLLLELVSSQDAKVKTANLVLKSIILTCKKSIDRPPVFRSLQKYTMPKLTIDNYGILLATEVPRVKLRHVGTADTKEVPCSKYSYQKGAFEPCLLSKSTFGWVYNRPATEILLHSLDKIANTGESFQGKNILITGAGKNSIGAEVLKGILAGGARVLVTTSSCTPEALDFFQSIFSSYGAYGSQLIVVPFNQGSQQDIGALISYVYEESSLGWDLDIILPFAAIPQTGQIDKIDSKSELAHRVMLTNTIRLVGAIKHEKQRRGYHTRPAQVVLPLSPNHGTIGGDGLYAESKMALESLLSKSRSEDWSQYLTICGASIGWTRGTGLMSKNDIIATEIERIGIRTFSTQEMAANILALVTSSIADLCQEEPLLADLNGGLNSALDLSHTLKQIRREIQITSELHAALLVDAQRDASIVKGINSSSELAEQCRLSDTTIRQRANIKLSFPSLLNYETEIQPLADKLGGTVNLEQVVVIVGFAELGPYGNSRTRWCMETNSTFSIESWIELAWLMRLIVHIDGVIDGAPYCGWIDAKTGKKLHDDEIRGHYREYILENCGIRDFKLSGNSHNLHQVAIQRDLDPFDASKEEAEEFKRLHGNKVDVFVEASSEQWKVRIKEGAVLMIPKAISTTRVAGQIPEGWNPKIYGIPEDIISQVDPVTLYALVCVSEALISSGIVEIYELYDHIPSSSVGNCIGSGMGGMSSLVKLYKDRYTNQSIQSDILQETFINTVSAWVNMLLLASNGPIRTPVGACATSIESLDSGCELIKSGRTKLCLVGGVDDLTDEVAAEFSNMKATVDPTLEHLKGRTPKEMSRPMSSTRAGFVESQGCGVQVICSAKLALEMGLPIHAVVAFTGTASDGLGRSVPAPGKGISSFATETPCPYPIRHLDIDYRRRILAQKLAHASQTRDASLEWLESEISALRSSRSINSSSSLEEFRLHHLSAINTAYATDLNSARSSVTRTLNTSPHISPLRAALATFNLTPASITIVSLHGTSTSLGDLNECRVLADQFTRLNRTGPPALAVCQKHLTGHGKGAAGAWAINGACQILDSDVVPGNRTLDDVEPSLEDLGQHLTFPKETLRLPDGTAKVVSVTGFGFGQKGGQVLLVHPRYLFACLADEDEEKGVVGGGGKGVYDEYVKKVKHRRRKADREFLKRMIRNNLVDIKEKGPIEGR